MEEISGVQTGYARSFALLVGGVLLGTACGKVAHDNESAPLHAAGAKGAADPIDVEGGDEVPVDGDESTEPLPIVPHDGWVDAASNPLAIQGAAFAYADDVSREGMIQDFSGKNACIAGSGARVELSCTPVLPATDCFGTLWGAAIGINLNQPVDPATGQGLMPQAYDASGLAGFAFTLSGARLPAGMRFKVEDSSDEYCTWKPLQAGRKGAVQRARDRVLGAREARRPQRRERASQSDQDLVAGRHQHRFADAVRLLRVGCRRPRSRRALKLRGRRPSLARAA